MAIAAILQMKRNVLIICMIVYLCLTININYNILNYKYNVLYQRIIKYKITTYIPYILYYFKYIWIFYDVSVKLVIFVLKLYIFLYYLNLINYVVMLCKLCIQICNQFVFEKLKILSSL